jgi:hypothetical protein
MKGYETQTNKAQMLLRLLSRRYRAAEPNTVTPLSQRIMGSLQRSLCLDDFSAPLLGEVDVRD